MLDEDGKGEQTLRYTLSPS